MPDEPFSFDFRNCPLYQQSVDWYKTVGSPLQDPGTIDVVYEYAQARYDEVVAAKKTVEEKADSLLKFVAGMAGGLLALFKVSGTLSTMGAELAPALILLSISAVLCIAARRSDAWSTPTDLPGLFKNNITPAAMKQLLAKSLYVASEGGKYVVRQKSRCVQSATLFAVVGVIALSLIASHGHGL